MGLDQWLRRIRRLTDNEMAALRGVPTNEMHDILVLDIDTKEQRTALEPIMPWLRTISRSVEEWDMDKVRKACGAPETANIVGWGGGTISFMDGAGGRWRFACGAPQAEDCARKVRRKFGVCWFTKVKYWRKEYDVQSAFNDALPYVVENCGYYPVQGEALDELMPMLERWGLSREDMEPAEDSVVCYHEWY